ncbi:MAG: FtsX-like permease family protein [Subtercola sp.]|nr:FtsX-like permease family protein [Subtercola sp.]
MSHEKTGAHAVRRRTADSAGCDYPAPGRIRGSAAAGSGEETRGQAVPRRGASPRIRWRQGAALLREAAAAALAARVTSAVAVTIVAVLCAVVVLTTGRAVGAQNAIVTSIDSENTRSIVVRAPESSGLDTSVLGRLAYATQISSVTAFGPADDVRNALVAGGTRVALRQQYSTATATATAIATATATETETETATATATATARAPRAIASPAAARALGLADGVGSVVSVASSAEYLVDQTTALPPGLEMLDPVVVVPAVADAEHPLPVSVLVVVAATSAQVVPVTALVESELAVLDRSKVTVTTSEQLAALSAAVQSQLGDFSRSLTLLVFGVGSVLVTAVVYALVLLRRRDFGRRRALGASRSLIVTLLLTQVALLGSLGAVAGCTAADLVLTLTGDPPPTFTFTFAVADLAVLTAVVASVIPAVVASTRDPLRELRVA